MRALIQYATQRFGDDVLRAHDEYELDERIEGIVASDAIGHFCALVADALVADGLPNTDLPAEIDTRSVSKLFGPEFAANISEGVRLSREAQRVTERFFEPGSAEMHEAVAYFRVVVARNPLSDPTLLPEEVIALHGLFTSIVCVVALGDAVGRTHVDLVTTLNWLSKRWVTGLREWLRLVASDPATNVSLDVVPLDQRYDLAEIRHQHGLAEAGIAAMAEHARLTGEAFAPFGAHGDE